MSTPLIQTVNLQKYFKVSDGLLHAVDDVNIFIDKGKTLGVVGESGCGKTTLGRVILRLLPANGGQILYDGNDILQYSKHKLRKLRKQMQIIFQDPYSSINPRLSVSEIIAEPMRVSHMYFTNADLHKRVSELMDTVGLADRLKNAYPHELDGGRRQRIGIARALSVRPQFIVCDEPVSALDVSIQAQILNLLMDLQDEMGLTYMFITHDLSVVKHISDDIMVMYLGQSVEQAPADELIVNPLHPYTRALLSAVQIPDLRYRTENREIIRGEVISPVNPKFGCRFVDRCPQARDICRNNNTSLVEHSPGHFVACTLYMDS